jgi:hypothetical protein
MWIYRAHYCSKGSVACRCSLSQPSTFEASTYPVVLSQPLVEVPAFGILSFISLPLLVFGGLCYFVYRFVIFRLLIVVR